MKKIFSLVMLYLTTFVNNSSSQSIDGVNLEDLFLEAAGTLKPRIKTIELSTKVKLEYAEQGNHDGIPVIFLHGITDSWHSFETVLTKLPASIHAFALTQRGHGNSSKPDNEYSPGNFSSDVAAFINQKKLGSVFIVGHSMGGVNAQQFALDHPQLIRGVVIVGSDPSFRNNPVVPEVYQEVLKLEGTNDKKFMEEFQRSTLVKPIDSAYFNLFVAEGLKTPARVFKAAFRGIMEVDFTEELKKIKAPVLILWGAEDVICIRKGQDTMKQNIKNSKLLVYEATGHALHWEQPERFTKDLLDFINTNNF